MTAESFLGDVEDEALVVCGCPEDTGDVDDGAEKVQRAGQGRTMAMPSACEAATSGAWCVAWVGRLAVLGAHMYCAEGVVLGEL